MKRELTRQLVHVLLGILAIPGFYLEQWQAVVAFAILTLLAIKIAPHDKVKRHWFREQENHLLSGAVLYFGSLTAIAILFPVKITALAWLVLAFGDGFATLAGTHISRQKLFWNSDKSWVGTFAFILCATVALLIAQLIFEPLLSLRQTGITSLAIASMVALVESLPWKLNDNVTVPLSAAILLLIFA